MEILKHEQERIEREAEREATGQIQTHTPVQHEIGPYDRILELAIETKDLDKLKQFMDLKDRHEANEARKSYHAAMTAFKADPPRITKDRNVKFGNTEYAHPSLSHVTETISSALSKHGLTASWKTDQREGLVTVTCTITHILGHSESTSLSASPDTSGSKNSIQAIGSAITYLQRYTLLSLSGLAAHDQDDDGNTTEAELITSEQVLELERLLADVSADKEKFLKFVGHTSLDQIRAEGFDQVVKIIRSKQRSPGEEG